jgi:hypothetical protein
VVWVWPVVCRCAGGTGHVEQVPLSGIVLSGGLHQHGIPSATCADSPRRRRAALHQQIDASSVRAVWIDAMQGKRTPDSCLWFPSA